MIEAKLEKQSHPIIVIKKTIAKESIIASMHGRCLIYKYSNRNNSLICKRNNKCCSAKVSFDVQEFLELAADSSEIAIFGLFPVTWNDRGESSVTFVLPKLDVKHT